ncbi:DUF2716 domain-containing protein [Niallia sp. 03133]|uniref:DUF2716 domain-containing protein n=1 Tax=Niallia sp. 03133 TaxID=3458060 RepID=UPI00404399D3
MNNWSMLSNGQNDLLWEIVVTKFNFRPSIKKRRFFMPYQVPKPFITYDISSYFENTAADTIMDDLENKTLEVFMECTMLNEKIYALDYQHPGYEFDPRKTMDRDEFNEWIVPIFPNGDYYFFFQKNFEWGILGHPWREEMMIFGEKLIDSYKKHMPILFKDNVVEQES